MFVMVRLSRNWEHKIIIIFFSGLICWLNFGDIILLFYSFFGGVKCIYSFQYFFLYSVEPYRSRVELFHGGTPDFYYTPVVYGTERKQSSHALESENKSMNPSSFFYSFFHFLFFHIRCYYADELWPFGFIFFLYCFITGFLSRREIFMVLYSLVRTSMVDATDKEL